MTATLTSSELTRADRCDRCGAAAKVRAKLPSGAELLFCQHHANEHEAKLIELAAVLEVSLGRDGRRVIPQPLNLGRTALRQECWTGHE